MPGATGTRAQASEATRSQLVEAASTLFVRDGYSSVSVRDIASTCGLTIGAIYSRFRNKADLLVAAIEERVRTDMEGDRRLHTERVLPDAASEADANWSLETILFTNAERYPRRATLRALLLEGAAAARQDAEVRERLADEQRAHLDWWFEVYREWARLRGVDRSVDMDAIVTYMWSAELGLAMLEAWGIKPPAPKKWRAVTERVLGSLRPKPSRSDRSTRSRSRQPR
jgi:AcrR family transcriptional regulator